LQIELKKKKKIKNKGNKFDELKMRPYQTSRSEDNQRWGKKRRGEVERMI